MRRTSVPRVCLIATLIVAGLATPGNAYIRPGTTIRVNVNSQGEQEQSAAPWVRNAGIAISGNGRYVAFESVGDNLIPNDNISPRPDSYVQIFVHDVATGETEIASVSSSGEQMVGPSTVLCTTLAPTFCPTTYLDGISDDGRLVAFTSDAINLVPGDTNSAQDVFVHDMRTGDTTRVSVSSDGDQSCPAAPTSELASCRSWWGSISGNGRYVAFSSTSSTLVRDDTNDFNDVFVHDLETRKTEIVSISSKGVQGNGPSVGSSTGGPSLSATGRYVVFDSNATNLTPEADIGVFLRDRMRNTTRMVSVRKDGYTGNTGVGTDARSGRLVNAVSRNGRWVVFASAGWKFVPNDRLLGAGDAFVRDMETGRIERVSVASDGTHYEDALTKTALGNPTGITPDGRFVVISGFGLEEGARPHDECSSPNRSGFSGRVWVHDRETGATVIVSRSSSGAEPLADDPRDAGDSSCWGPGGPNAPGRYGSARADFGRISGDGQEVVFISNGTNLVEGDTNHMVDVFWRAIGPDLGTGSLATSGTLKVADDDRFSTTGVVTGMDSTADLNSVLTRQGANLYGASLAYRPLYEDLFARIELEHMPTVTGVPAGGILYGLSFTADGTDYQVRVQRVPGPDYVEAGGASFGLFKQDPDTDLYVKVGSITGGYGTTGEEVVFSLPLDRIGLESGGELGDIEAFTALGGYDTGPARVLDSMALSAAN